MASVDQKYLDPNLFLTAPYTRGEDPLAIVFIDPATNTYAGAVGTPIIEGSVSGVKYMPIIFINPNTGSAE